MQHFLHLDLERTKITDAGLERLTDLTQLQARTGKRLESRCKICSTTQVRALVAKEPGKIFGEGEFELRDRLNQVGATVLEESVNAQAKKGVPRC